MRCGAETEIYRGGHCWRCELADQIDQLLTNPATGTINEQLQPLAAALKHMHRPNSGVTWLRNPQVRAALQQLAHAETITPELLDALPRGRITTHIRALLGHYGIAQAKLTYRQRFDRWATTKLTTVTAPQAQLVLRAFIRWHLAHKLDHSCTEGRFLASKQTVTVAAEFLNWIAAQDISFDTITQLDVDRFLAEGTQTRRRLDRFLPWAIKTYRLAPMQITPHQRDTTQEKTTQEQIDQLRTLFSHPDMTAQDRLMAALILVFGQPTHKVVALTWTHIHTTLDGAVTITLGKHPILLEPPLDGLINDVRISTTNRQTATNRDSAHVFPGGLPGVHLTSNHARVRLKTLGFPSRATRIGAWRTITQSAPPPVLADALGIHPQTAIRHAVLGASQYGAYVADLDKYSR